MSTNNKEPRKRRRGRGEIDALVSAYRLSGLSVREYCEREYVATSQMYKWLRRDRAEATEGIVELPWSGRSELTICFPDGLRLQIPYDAPNRCVAQALHALGVRT